MPVVPEYGKWYNEMAVNGETVFKRRRNIEGTGRK